MILDNIVCLRTFSVRRGAIGRLSESDDVLFEPAAEGSAFSGYPR